MYIYIYIYLYSYIGGWAERVRLQAGPPVTGESFQLFVRACVRARGGMLDNMEYDMQHILCDM